MNPDHRSPSKIAVMGAGSWGTTFAKVLADSGIDDGVQVVLWARRPAIAEEISSHHTNRRYLRDTVLPANVSATADPAEALAGAELVVLAVPAQSLRSNLRAFKVHVPGNAVVVSLMKGLEGGTDARMSEVIAQELGWPEERIAVVSGPNLALEIAREEPTASVVACTDPAVGAWIARACTPRYFRPYTNTDLIGVEVGGIVKNVIALAVGICNGRGVGDNTKASVITRGLAETTRLALALGGRLDTMSGLAGLGDLVATCASSLSRNNTAGRLLGQGLSLDEVNERMTQTAEAIKSGPAVLDLARRNGIEMPITEAVVMLLEGSLSVDDMAARLLGRDLKAEGESA